ncbi:MAG: D-glycero-beta-D-manno-heptose 1,7-bisphosphate 7-phosphatase [Candidatus Promineifilaceae bacterium]|nr:D-glycero-beta-D-manno-heptose 1,7-bisphosphate 7-phosphatase [Candidatus Promineifilaceae bacterium]
MLNRAVFLDRDGTINEEVHHLSAVDQFRILPTAVEAIRLLNQSHFRVIVITNQSVVARGIISEQTLADIHLFMIEQLEALGAHIHGIYYCPHHPTAGKGSLKITCDCRKPQPGMLLQAAAEQNIELSQSFMVGDKISDLASGLAAGCKTVLVQTGYGKETEKLVEGRADLPNMIAPNLLEAAQWILQQTA